MQLRFKSHDHANDYPDVICSALFDSSQHGNFIKLEQFWLRAVVAKNPKIPHFQKVESQKWKSITSYCHQWFGDFGRDDV